jgi:DNA replication and repair protein RecF
MADPSYIRLLKEYRRILNQRNAALKMQASRDERKAWNAKLVEKGCALLVERLGITAVLKRYVLEHAAEMKTPFGFSLEYDSVIVREGAILAGSGADPGFDEITAVFETRLAAVEREEIRRGTTMVGPHRDDIAIQIDGREVRKFGSQGQRRLLAILLKLAELSHLETELNEPCVLLLDDVFAEFDAEITDKLQGLLEGDRQVFVTSPVRLGWAASRDVRVFTVSAGRVTAD